MQVVQRNTGKATIALRKGPSSLVSERLWVIEHHKMRSHRFHIKVKNVMAFP